MTDNLHVIVGAGAIGTATARLLAERGEHVRVVTRSGGGPDVGGVERVAADATDTERLAELTKGAEALYNCANPRYDRWPVDWPPLAASFLAAAEASGAVLVTVSNLYGYGPVDGPMTEDLPLAAPGTKGRIRARMWEDALAAHRAGRIRATEVRGSDYIGPRAESQLGERVVPRVLAGKGVRLLGDVDLAHTWTYVDDVARLLAAVAADERAWGKPWHVPSPEPCSQRHAVGDIAAAAGVKPVRVGRIPSLVLQAAGVFSPVIRELGEVGYQTRRPFVMDSSAAQATFGLAPTPWPDVISQTVAWYRPRS
jgi:nucleoside-diphosphate-sugar epimerase